MSCKSKITPFDAETILMVRNVIGMEPIIKEGETEYCIVIPSVKNNTALENAIAGRLGERLIACNETEINATFRVEYQKNADYMPTESRTDYWKPNPKAGERFCRKLLEVDAIQVTRENIDKVREFTGGGTMTIPSCPGVIGQYTFPTLNGVFLDVPEGWFIIRYSNGNYDKISPKEFIAEFEQKEGENLLQYFNSKFGTNIAPRCRKLSEEYGELMDVLAKADVMDDKAFVAEFVDELADLNAVVYHIAAILGLSQDELLKKATDKIKGRETNPDYKRRHPHNVPKHNRKPGFIQKLIELINEHGLENEFANTPDFVLAGVAFEAMNNFAQGVKNRERWYGRGNEVENVCVDTDGCLSDFPETQDVTPGCEVCGNCRWFESPDDEGDANCKKQNRRRHNSCLACDGWENGIGGGK